MSKYISAEDLQRMLEEMEYEASMLQPIHIYPTNLVPIPLNEFELADYQYYDGLTQMFADGK